MLRSLCPHSLFVLSLCVLPLAVPIAQTGGMHGQHAAHGAHNQPHSATADTPQPDSTKAYQAANDKMHAGMNIEFTGNPDIDFLRGMIPHHQGAVDMAQIQLKYGHHPQLKRLTREIIRAQNGEIRMMQKLLEQLEKLDAGWHDRTWLGEHNEAQN